MMELYRYDETFLGINNFALIIYNYIDSRHTTSLPVHGEASAKTAIYRERFMLLKQRVSCGEYFSRPVFDAETKEFVCMLSLLDIFRPVSNS